MITYPVLKTKYIAVPIDIQEVSQWLRLDIPGYSGEDSKLGQLIYAAIDYVETECNLSLGLSEYEWYVDCLPCKFRDREQVSSIISIEQEGDSGFTEIPNTNYSLIRISERQSLIRWNSSFETSATAFKVTFMAGYEDVSKVPPRLMQAVRALIAEWYDSPGDYVREKVTMADRLLAPYVIAYAG